jgi:hypothetical protein
VDSISELKRDISPALLTDLNKELLTGETILISLPGSFGEALVVTDRRAMVVRERDSALVPMADVFAYPLGLVTGAVAVTSGAGGYIELRLAGPVSQPDSARVYFPLQEEAAFKAAADYLSKLPSMQQPKATPVSAVSGVSDQGACPNCGAKVGDEAAFCSGCGAAVRTLCLACGASTPVGSKFCAHCGRDLVEFTPACHKCGARILRWMQFCPDCGSNQRPVCAGCGVQVMPDWKHCASCGRLLGSDRVDSCCSGSARRMVQGLRDQESQRQSSEPAEAQAPAVDNSAESYNKRGTELCDNEDYYGAIHQFQAAIAIDPNKAAYHCNLAVAYDGADRDAEALAEYQKTLQLAPNDLTALLYLGYMYSENEEMDKAQEVWGRILQIAPDSAEAQEVQQNLRHQGEL